MTFVSSALPNNNFSFFPLIYTGTDLSFQNCISLLQIALPMLPATTVDSALLQLAVIAKSGITPSPVVVNRVTSPFSASTVTYNTRPAFAATTSQINIAKSDLYTTVRIDITALVNGWLDGTYENYGIALANPDGATVVQFATNNSVYKPYFPKLILTYSTPVQPTAASCFSYAQLAHVVEQLIALYPTNVMTVFTTGLNASTVTGTPYRLYSSPEGTYGAIFILMDNGQQEAIPLNAIAAIYTGDGTVYDPSITYLSPPTLPESYDTNLITAMHDYLPVSTEVEMYMGSLVVATGMIYKNEYGILVLSDEDGNTPVFIPVRNITAILPSNMTGGLKKAGRPHVEVINKTDCKSK
jgi:hypothetical protein